MSNVSTKFQFDSTQQFHRARKNYFRIKSHRLSSKSPADLIIINCIRSSCSLDLNSQKGTKIFVLKQDGRT